MCVHIHEFAPEHSVTNSMRVALLMYVHTQKSALCLCVSIFMSSRQSTLAVTNSTRVALLFKKIMRSRKKHISNVSSRVCVLVLKRQLAVK